ncbi:MAG: transposase [Alphaproteobacteria bacterium]|nr:transposase [Alphaproteobacteria bacterium]
MGRPHPMALRERVVGFVEEGNSHRSADARFRVSVKFVNDMVILKRETGGLAPRVQGHGGGHGKLVGVGDWITARMKAKPDLTLNDLVGELSDHHGIAIHRVSVWRFLRDLGLTHKKRFASPRAEAA